MLLKWGIGPAIVSYLGHLDCIGDNSAHRVVVFFSANFFEVLMSEEKCILIVDDEAFIRVLLTQTLEELEDEGVELLVAADGQEGLDVALSERPDLVFLDVMMPKLSGYEVCSKIKETDPSIYVILLTAKGQAVDKEQGTDVGADEYVTKPFDPDYILERAAEILDVDLYM